MRSVDISFVVPPTRAYSRIVPFPCIYLAAFLEERGIRCQIIDIKSEALRPNEQKIERQIVNELIKISSPYIGFTCLTAEYLSVMRIMQMLRSEAYQGKIIVGGHHATFCPGDFIFDGSPCDYAVLGEGEITLFELIKSLEEKKDAHDVDGLVFFNGKVIRTNHRELIEDLSILPLPAYSHLDMEFYTFPRTSLIRYNVLSGIDVQTTRGCPHNCTFCGNPSLWAVHRYRKRFRCRPIFHILDEIEFLYDQYKIDSFYINDDSFTVSEGRVREFCEGINKRGLNLIWGVQTRVNLLTEGMVSVMADSGCIQVDLGVESGSQRILRVMKKGITIEQIERAFSLCKMYRLRTLANFMINTPTETEEDLSKTIRLAKRLKATHYGFMVTVPLLGTRIYEEYVNPKLTKEEYCLYLGSRPYRQIVDPRFKLCKHEKDIRKLAILLFLRFTAISLYFDPIFSIFKHFKTYCFSTRRRKYIKAFFYLYFSQFARHLMYIFETFFYQLKSILKFKN